MKIQGIKYLFTALCILSMLAFTSCSAGASVDAGVDEDGVSVGAGAEAEAGDN